MYNHKVKQVRFSYFKSNFKSNGINPNKAVVLFLEKPVISNNEAEPKKIQLKKSFFFKHMSKVFLKKNSIAGGGSMFKTVFDVKTDRKSFIKFFKENSCLIGYNSFYWTLNKMVFIALEKNNREALVSLLFQNLKKTLSVFLPLKCLLSSLKLESSKNIG